MPVGEGTQERTQRRRRPGPLEELRQGPVPQPAGVLDAVPPPHIAATSDATFFAAGFAPPLLSAPQMPTDSRTRADSRPRSASRTTGSSPASATRFRSSTLAETADAAPACFAGPSARQRSGRHGSHAVTGILNAFRCSEVKYHGTLESLCPEVVVHESRHIAWRAAAMEFGRACHGGRCLGEAVARSAVRDGKDAKAVRNTRVLIGCLQELVGGAISRTIRNCATYPEVLWLADVPQGLLRRAVSLKIIDTGGWCTSERTWRWRSPWGPLRLRGDTLRRHGRAHGATTGGEGERPRRQA